jgi:hypothetical protein
MREVGLTRAVVVDTPTLQMIDLWIPDVDGRRLLSPRYTQHGTGYEAAADDPASQKSLTMVR